VIYKFNDSNDIKVFLFKNVLHTYQLQSTVIVQ